MSVVFISPGQNQKMFFLGIAIIALLFMSAVFIGVFFYTPSQPSSVMVFNMPKVPVDTKILTSEQFRKLLPFNEMRAQYSYVATKNNKQQNGFIVADSEEQAKTVLESQGFKVSSLKEIVVGRDNPFVPYYQIIKKPAATK